MARQLFGTDGIRAVAGEYPLDTKTTHALGCALGQWAAKHAEHPEIVIGMDTRESGPMLAAQVAAGLAEAGVKTRFAGLITTPGVAYLTRTRDFVAGVMISASHNPYQDNGIKVFDHSGFKLPDDDEHELETKIFKLLKEGVEPVAAHLTVDEGLDADYVNFLVSTMKRDLSGIELIIDSANGAASHLSTELFERLGAKVHSIGCSPDGRNINKGCGALHVEDLQREVLARGADAGVAFDGDADRCILVSGKGKIIDGDAMLLLVANSMRSTGALKGNLVVATVMSNLGLERALTDNGIGLLRTPVGDKYVLEEMVRRDAAIGGEQSGHVIFRDYATTGDGMLTALRILEITAMTGKSLDELTEGLTIYPQILVNVRVKERKPILDLLEVQKQIRQVENHFGDSGRVLVRFSGTEPLARVMVEGPEIGEVQAAANRIADAIRMELGSAL
jgi:phosphoglucosamine mutase